MRKSHSSKTIFTAALLFLGILQTIAQNAPRTFRSINPDNGLVRCASTEYEEYLRETNPALSAEQAQFEDWMAKKIQEGKSLRQQNPGDVNAVMTIPVVVHVIHNGDMVGNNENIANAQVISQITVLNQDFRRMAGTPGNNDPRGVDTEIEFCLAKVDPQGNPTTGIDRINAGQQSWNSFDEVNNTLKPNTQWDPTQYFNIWVVNFGGELNQILGFAQFPSSSGLGGLNTNGGPAASDGVVIGYGFFGSSAIYSSGSYAPPYNRGRTATHEVGHALGLIHIWGDNSSCQVNGTDSFKDYCPDTPAAADANYDCIYSDSCLFSAEIDMVENYMDYTNDACMSIFTENQKTRLRTVLQNSPRRASLLNSVVCQEIAGVEEYNLLNGINLYPNPTNSVLNVQTPDNELPDSFTIYNSLGQTITTVNVKGNANLIINTSAYSNGVYFIKVDKGTATKTLKFIKN